MSEPVTEIRTSLLIPEGTSHTYVQVLESVEAETVIATSETSPDTLRLASEIVSSNVTVIFTLSKS